jgi:hypothetical protein
VGSHLRAPRGEKFHKKLAKGGTFRDENSAGVEVGHHAKGGHIKVTANRKVAGDGERPSTPQPGIPKPRQFADFKRGGKVKGC